MKYRGVRKKQQMQNESRDSDRDTWILVEPPSGHNVIGTRWVFKNKQNEDGSVVRNKARFQTLFLSKFSNSSCMALTQFESDKVCEISRGSKEATNTE